VVPASLRLIHALYPGGHSYCLDYNSKTGEWEKTNITIGIIPNVTTGGGKLLGLIKNLAKGKEALSVAKGVNVVIKEGEIAQVLIKDNKVIGYSTKVIKHDALARSLGLNPKEVTGATALYVGGKLIVAPSSSVPGATREVLDLLFNLLY
jgi:hypothetical protein